jgi:hypothetical protein
MMVMRTGTLSMLLFFVSFIFTGPLHAGTLSVGGRSFYAQWDSGVAGMTAAAVEAQLKREMEAGVAVLVSSATTTTWKSANPKDAALSSDRYWGIRPATEDGTRPFPSCGLVLIPHALNRGWM